MDAARFMSRLSFDLTCEVSASLYERRRAPYPLACAGFPKLTEDKSMNIKKFVLAVLLLPTMTTAQTLHYAGSQCLTGNH